MKSSISLSRSCRGTAFTQQGNKPPKSQLSSNSSQRTHLRHWQAPVFQQTILLPWDFRAGSIILQKKVKQIHLCQGIHFLWARHLSKTPKVSTGTTGDTSLALRCPSDPRGPYRPRAMSTAGMDNSQVLLQPDYYSTTGDNNTVFSPQGYCDPATGAKLHPEHKSCRKERKSETIPDLMVWRACKVLLFHRSPKVPYPPWCVPSRKFPVPGKLRMVIVEV